MSDTIRSETLIEDYNKMLRENIKLKDREKKLTSLVKELCSFKIYDDYKFITDQNKNYYAQPVIFPLDEFENLNRRARLALKNLEVE